MKIIVLLLSITFSFSDSPLDHWIKEKTKIINKHKFILTFEYSFKGDSSLRFNDDNFIYYQFDEDSTRTYTNNRIIVQHSGYTEIIDDSTKQIFLQKKEEDKLSGKVLSIFKNKNYKIIQYSSNKYLLSLNDYYLNMNIVYNKKNNFISTLSFSENLDSIYLEKINISILDSVPIDSINRNSYDIFDLR